MKLRSPLREIEKKTVTFGIKQKKSGTRNHSWNFSKNLNILKLQIFFKETHI